MALLDDNPPISDGLADRRARHRVASAKYDAKHRAQKRIRTAQRYHADIENSRARKLESYYRNKERYRTWYETRKADPEFKAKRAQQRKLSREKSRADDPVEFASRETRRRRARASTPSGWAAQQIRSIRHRAKKSGLAFSIVASDIVIPTFCPVLGIRIIDEDGKVISKVVSVDRFDNTKGYTKENIRVISLRANLLKKDATITEIRQLLHYMENGK